MRRIGNRLLSIRWNGYWEFDGLTIRLVVRIGFFHDVPGNPTVQMLYHTDIDGFFLVIAHFDLERFVEPLPICIEPVVSTPALPG
jgi:hypothetical protein